MDRAVIVSPHLDDAVLSVGQLMAGRPEMMVITVFSGVPQDCEQTNTYDANCGFTSAAEAMTQRRLEDQAALRLLDADPVWLDFADHQYNEPADEDEILDRLLTAVAAIVSPTLLIGPLGLIHPDHLATRRAYQRLVSETGIEAWIYEELPYRVSFPDEVPDALAWWKEQGHKPELGFIGTGPLERKEAALSCYTSQLWALDLHCCLVPERLWRLW